MYIISPIGDPLNSSVSSSRTYALPPGANAFWIQAQTQNVRISLTNAEATTSTGLQVKAGDPVRLLTLGAGRSFKAIQESATAVFYVQPVSVGWVED